MIEDIAVVLIVLWAVFRLMRPRLVTRGKRPTGGCSNCGTCGTGCSTPRWRPPA